MVVTMSSKGQLVIPRAIREQLQLKAGTKFAVELNQNQIILKPVFDTKQIYAVIDALYGRFANSGLLTELAHERELERQRDKDRGL